MNVLLVSTYEMGHQPLGLARPAAHLRAAGHEVRCQDLAVDHLDESLVRAAEFVGISVPMHTAARLGIAAAARIRALNRQAHICFYGLYASLNAEVLVPRYADSVIGGELEEPLAHLVDRLAAGAGGDLPPGVQTVAGGGTTFLGRQSFAVPARDLLPPLDRYARLDDGTGQHLAGYVEASRGCAHRCLHCPIPPVYGGRVRIVAEDVVLEDVRQLVDLGARHVTFGDPDFFNGVKHSLRIVDRVHREFPSLTYDATIKIEHLLEHAALLPRLAETGCAFVVSAVESVDDRVLATLNKGHTSADVEKALDLARAAGLVLRPTLLPFTPWTSLDRYLDLLDFVERQGLVHHVDPVQFSIRLLVPRGSSLLDSPEMRPHLGSFDEAALSYTWRTPDPRVDALQRAVAGAVEAAAAQGESTPATFHRIRSLARAAAGSARAEAPTNLDATPACPVPRLTEPWFC